MFYHHYYDVYTSTKVNSLYIFCLFTDACFPHSKSEFPDWTKEQNIFC